jgi:hypothetical protein
MIFLGLERRSRLGGRVSLAQVVTESLLVDLSAHPRWLVVLVGTFVAALAIWIVIKLLKLALWLLFFAVLLGGTFWAAFLWLE